MSQINKPTDYFNTVLYTGNGTAIGSGGNTVTGVGFQPDLVWGKARSGTDAVDNHQLIDVVRGVTKSLISNNTTVEGTYTEGLTSFTSDGFTLGSNGMLNRNGNNCVAWNWLAGGTASSNTDGSITSSVSANTTSGFSIVSWSGSGATGTIGHGLGTEPSVIIPKCRTQTADWYSYWKPLGNGNAVRLNTTDASASTGIWNNTSPTSSVFSVINNAVINQSGHTYVAYCFAEKKGFSKFGSYNGNGSTDGPFIYTGFKPAFLIWKRSDVANDWYVVDNKRDAFNEVDANLFPNLNGAESIGNGYNGVDFLSNGVKVRQGNSSINNSSGTYIYMVFAENPLVGTNNIPATAR